MKTIFQKIFGLSDPSVVEANTKHKVTAPIAASPIKSASARELDHLLRGTYRFVAVDVETANRNQGSICQIGMALVSSDGRIDTVGILIDPEQDFEDFNVDLHGIDEETVRGALTFDLALQTLRPFLNGTS